MVMSKREIGQRVIRWSDAHQSDAVSKAETYRTLRPKPLTNAQLSSLQGIVEAAPAYSEVRDYIRNQGDKASRAGSGPAEMRNFWLDLDQTLGGLRNDAETILGAFLDLNSMSKKEKQTELDELHRRLMREYVQHFVAHCLYLTPEAEGE
jgi:hypothetical protein